MSLPDQYVAVRNLGLVQRQAGVDAEIVELVQAFAKLRANAGLPVRFDFEEFAAGTIEARICQRLCALNPGRDVRFVRFLAAYGAALERRGMRALFGTAHLARELGLGRNQLFKIASRTSQSYRELRIPKPGGGERVLMAPFGRLSGIQRWILRHILDRAAPHAAAHGFVKRRSIVTNARPHTGKLIVVRLDLDNFFPSIPVTAVRKAIQRLGYPYSVAAALASLCTVDGWLPQGACTSPALSNLVSINLDRRFTALASRLSFTYTRYADDLVFSSNDPRFASLLPFLREVVQSEGYRVNEGKTRLMRQGNTQLVTGIVTNAGVGLKREQVRRMRAALHRLRTQGPDAVVFPSRAGRNADPVQVLRGHLALLRMVDPRRASKLQS